MSTDDGTIGGYFLGDGTKTMACPHCGRILEVDIDDILPVHSDSCTLVADFDAKGRMFIKETVEGPEICEGSWEVKGVPIKFTFFKAGDKKP